MHRSQHNSSRHRRHDSDKDDIYHHQRHSFDSKHEKQNINNSPSPGEKNSSFSFVKYRHELNKIFSTIVNLVNDPDDFWKFVRKYEAIEEKHGSKNQLASVPNTYNSLGVPSSYHSIYNLNVSLNCKKHHLFDRISRSNDLTDDKLLRFRDIIVIYIGFKQKEKFSKLKKLRNEQDNLPVAKYRQEIVESVKNNRVIIIAGDTGCGKSTQVPQYLYTAGFCKIGNCFMLHTSNLRQGLMSFEKKMNKSFFWPL